MQRGTTKANTEMEEGKGAAGAQEAAKSLAFLLGSGALTNDKTRTRIQFMDVMWAASSRIAGWEHVC